METFISLHPASNYTAVALFSIAEISDTADKVKLYKKGLNTPLPDHSDLGYYKYGAAKQLTEVYIAQANYLAASKYLTLAKTVFAPRPDCGNARADFLKEIKALETLLAKKIRGSRTIASLTP